MKRVVPELFFYRSYFIRVDSWKEFFISIYVSIFFAVYYRFCYDFLFLLNNNLCLFFLFNAIRSVLLDYFNLLSFLSLLFLSFCLLFLLLFGFKFKGIFFGGVNWRFNNWFFIVLFLFFGLWLQLLYFFDWFDIIDIFKAFGLLEFWHPAWGVADFWAGSFSSSHRALLMALVRTSGFKVYFWTLILGLFEAILVTFTSTFFLFGLLFFFRSSVFVVMLNFGSIFDILFDNFSESFFEERIVELYPFGKSVLAFYKLSFFLVSRFPEELGHEVEHFFEEGSGFDCWHWSIILEYNDSLI